MTVWRIVLALCLGLVRTKDDALAFLDSSETAP